MFAGLRAGGVAGGVTLGVRRSVGVVLVSVAHVSVVDVLFKAIINCSY